MQYFLGVDAGGTKAEFVLGDETRELARVRTGTIKRMKVSEDTAEANLLTALNQLTELSGVSMETITRCCIGTAGETVALVTDWLRQAFSRHVGGELILLGDVEIALDAAFTGGRGVLVLAGTGSNLAARAATGEMFTAGGWGPAMADQGSGHFLGLEALRRGFLALDQQRPTRLLEVVQAHWKLTSREALIELANANPAPNFSQLAPLVASCAEQGDAVAQEVVEQGGADLADLAALLIERMRGIEENAGLPFELPAVATAGSVVERVAPLRRTFQAHLDRRYPGIVVLDKPIDPPFGALWNARNRSPHGGHPAAKSRSEEPTAS